MTRAELIHQMALMTDAELEQCILIYKDGGKTKSTAVDTTELYKDIIELEWPALVGINYHVIEDPNFSASSIGYGSIETMLGEDAEYRDNDGNILYTYKNPYPGEVTIVLNPNEISNKKSAVKLDLLHVLRELDPTYNDLLNEVQFDVNDDLYQQLMDDITNNRTGGIDADHYLQNGIDGFLRNLFVEGTPEEIAAMNYNPDKQLEIYYNPGIAKGIGKLYLYLTSHKLGEVEVTPEDITIHKEGGTLENVNLDLLSQELNKEEEETYKLIKLCREGSILDLLKELLPDNEIFELISKFGIDDLLTGGIKKGTSVSIQIIMSDGDKEETGKTPKLQEIEIGDKTYKVEIVFTEKDMEKGLGERKSLDKDKGMLFDFKGVQEEVTFNCEEMLFPIDIIFINNDDEVIRVAENCLPGKDLFTENNVRYVLEVNAKSGIKQGDDFDISPSNSPTMKVLAPDGSTQMELLGGERIFSRIKTKLLIKWAKKADKSKSDSDYKRLGNIMFKELYAQDNRDPEYVEVPEN